MAGGARSPDRVAAVPAAAGSGITAGRQPNPARLRDRDGGEPDHSGGARSGPGEDVDQGAEPKLRPPAVVGRPAVVGGAGVQPVRGSGGGPEGRGPGGPRLVAQSPG